LGSNGRLIVDRKGPGRGAWLCKLGEPELAQPECIEKAVRRGAFGRALRAEVSRTDVGVLLAMASEHARIESTNGAAAKGRPKGHEEKD
jgi:predicted RNA-binding protein YlxR (DUF448 family)